MTEWAIFSILEIPKMCRILFAKMHFGVKRERESGTVFDTDWEDGLIIICFFDSFFKTSQCDTAMPKIVYCKKANLLFIREHSHF